MKHLFINMAKWYFTTTAHVYDENAVDGSDASSRDEELMSK